MRTCLALAPALLLGCAAPDTQLEPLPPVGRIQQSDPAFVQSDPASQRACRADADCGPGYLCHPGNRVCFSAYPNPRMLDISFGEPVDMSQCRPVTIYFAFDSAELVGDAMKWLDYDARCLAARHAQSLTIEAHCDARGDVEYNLALSRRRGESAKAYLQHLGVTIPIKVLGLGKSEPIQDKPNMTESDYAWNRRAEFRFE